MHEVLIGTLQVVFDAVVDGEKWEVGV